MVPFPPRHLIPRLGGRGKKDAARLSFLEPQIFISEHPPGFITDCYHPEQAGAQVGLCQTSCRAAICGDTARATLPNSTSLTRAALVARTACACRSAVTHEPRQR